LTAFAACAEAPAASTANTATRVFNILSTGGFHRLCCRAFAPLQRPYMRTNLNGNWMPRSCHNWKRRT